MPCIVGTVATGADPPLPSATRAVPADRLVAELVPPPRFAEVSFDSYRPDPAQPSQQARPWSGSGRSPADVGRAAARAAVRRRPGRPRGPRGLPRRRVRRRQDAPARLAVARRAGPEAVRDVRRADPPGRGARASTTRSTRSRRTPWSASTSSSSTTPATPCWSPRCSPGCARPGSGWRRPRTRCPAGSGEGRFATDDFLREIQGLVGAASSRCASTARTTGTAACPRRRRAGPATRCDARPPSTTAPASTTSSTCPGTWRRCTPRKYGALLDGVRRGAASRTCRTVDDQAVALRLVVLADRLYDRDLPVVASGVTFDALFAPPLLEGGYRKKYFRAVSRLVALAREGATSGLNRRSRGHTAAHGEVRASSPPPPRR